MAQEIDEAVQNPEKRGAKGSHLPGVRKKANKALPSNTSESLPTDSQHSEGPPPKQARTEASSSAVATTHAPPGLAGRNPIEVKKAPKKAKWEYATGACPWTTRRFSPFAGGMIEETCRTPIRWFQRSTADHEGWIKPWEGIPCYKCRKSIKFGLEQVGYCPLCNEGYTHPARRYYLCTECVIWGRQLE